MIKNIIILLILLIATGCSNSQKIEDEIYTYFDNAGYQCNENECTKSDSIKSGDVLESITNRNYSYNKITNTFIQTNETDIAGIILKNESKINFDTKKAEINLYLGTDFYTASYDFEKGEYIRYPEKEVEMEFSIFKSGIEGVYYDVIKSVDLD